MTKIVVTGTRGIPNIMGGVETHCEQLYPRLVKRKYDITLIRREAYVYDDLKSWKGVKLIDIPSPRLKAFEAIVHTWRAIWKAKKLHADIVHIHAIGPALLVPMARALGMKVVFTHHGPDYNRDKWGKPARFMLKIGESMGCHFANDVIVISQVIQDLIKEKYGRTKRVHLIYNGVTTPEFTSYPEYFKTLGIEEDNYILGMCRFVPEKKLHDLIHAYTKLKKQFRLQHGEAHRKFPKLVLAGDSNFPDEPYGIELKRLAAQNGVILTGFIKGRKLHSLLTNCLCYCLPSSHEGLPIALLEAMSYGVKVLVSDIPAHLEVNLPESDYFHCGDVDELAAKLADVVNKPKQHIHYDMSKYNWEHIANQTADIYRSLT